MEDRTKPYITRNERISRDFREKHGEKIETKKDFMPSFVFTRLIIFSLLVLFVFAIAKGETKLYSDLKVAYQSMIQKDMGKEELKETFSNLTQYVKENISKEGRVQSIKNKLLFNGQGGEDAPFFGKKASFSPLFITEPFHKPVEYKRVSSTFGQRENPVTHKRGFHTGMDLAAPMHTPIFAAFSGRVAQVEESKVRGKYIILEHGNGLTTLYCHCNEIFVQEGTLINGGEKIAEVGATGQVTGPHLHFEVKLNGISYNPSWLLLDDGNNN